MDFWFSEMQRRVAADELCKSPVQRPPARNAANACGKGCKADILPSIAKHNIVVLCRLRSSRQSHYVALAEGV